MLGIFYFMKVAFYYLFCIQNIQLFYCFDYEDKMIK